ncbi:MAG: hypothetical protein K0S58_2320 [Nitrospira sp.]|nr:hypothetical protein [Nitrospira sp.]
MKKTAAKKSTRTANTRSTKVASSRRKVDRPAKAVRRKPKAAAGVTAKEIKKAAKRIVGAPKRPASVPASTKRKAKEVGRAVGTVLGKAIGNVERVVNRVMKSTRITHKK